VETVAVGSTPYDVRVGSEYVASERSALPHTHCYTHTPGHRDGAGRAGGLLVRVDVVVEGLARMTLLSLPSLSPALTS